MLVIPAAFSPSESIKQRTSPDSLCSWVHMSKRAWLGKRRTDLGFELRTEDIPDLKTSCGHRIHPIHGCGVRPSVPWETVARVGRGHGVNSNHVGSSHKSMDDPWANAWGEPAKQASTTWSQKIRDDDQEPEADIATPSWTTGAGIQWAEPSVGQATLWQPASPKEWATSPYEDIKLGNPSSADHFPTRGQEVLETGLNPSPVLNHAVPGSTTPQEPAIDLRATSPTLASPTTTDPESPDAFGTFETGLDSGVTSVDPWSESTAVESTESVESDPWTTPWVSSTENATEGHGRQVDEWEVAKRQKEKQDQHVVRCRCSRVFFSSDILPSHHMYWRLSFMDFQPFRMNCGLRPPQRLLPLTITSSIDTGELPKSRVCKLA